MAEKKFSIPVMILMILCLPLIYLTGKSLVIEILAISPGNLFQMMFFIGFIVSALLFSVFKRRLNYFTTLEHELTHLLWAVLTLNTPTELHVKKHIGGMVAYQGKKNVMIVLSPYFFQTFTFLLFLVYLVINWTFYKWFYLILGVSVGYHLATDIREIPDRRQPDLQQYGFIPSLIIIMFFYLLSLGLILGFVEQGGFGGMWKYLVSVYGEGVSVRYLCRYFVL
ncbi:MAG: hypothetical protein ACOYNC_01000 [Bacteroidales bacterium]